jgi:hypothetical protein
MEARTVSPSLMDRFRLGEEVNMIVAKDRRTDETDSPNSA